MIPDILYKAKENNNWIEGYPVIQNEELFLFVKGSGRLVKIDKDTLCKKVYNEYYENDIFEYRGLKWVVKFEKTICGYQLTREDPTIHFTHFLPLSCIDDAKYLGNKVDSPELI